MHKLKTAPLCVQSRQRTLPEHRYLLQGRTEEGILETGEFSASKLELGREKGLRRKFGLGWVGKIWEGVWSDRHKRQQWTPPVLQGNRCKLAFTSYLHRFLAPTYP